MLSTLSASYPNNANVFFIVVSHSFKASTALCIAGMKDLTIGCITSPIVVFKVVSEAVNCATLPEYVLT